MKVGCEGCGASYSVADDKVAGRKLKMRCKKCNAAIIIDAAQRVTNPPFGEADAAEVTPLGTALEAIEEVRASWYVEGQDSSAQGPFTLAEVSAQIADGRVTGETLVFGEGFSDWQRASEIPELRVSLVTIPPLPTRAVPPVPQSTLSMGSDPFADPARPVSGISPRVDSDELLQIGLQREGTVQFSLDQIRALSSVSAPSVAPAPAPKPGYASGDGSGLIDMRSLYESQAEESYKPITGLMASPLDTMAPLTLPQSSPRTPEGVDMRTKVLAGLAALGFISAAAVAILALSRPDPAPVSAAAMPPAQPAAVAAPPPAAPPAAAAAQAAEPEEVAAAEPAAAQPEAADEAEEPKPVRAGALSARRASGGGKARKKAAADAAPAVAEAPARAKSERKTVDIDDLLGEKPKPAEKTAAKAAPKGGSSSIDELLEGAVSDKKAAPAKSEPADSGLPQTPSRDQMLAALGKAKAKAAQCKGSGVALAKITVTGNGKASKVTVSGVEGAAKSCVENAVRTTAFPKFQKDSMQVDFPFKLAG